MLHLLIGNDLCLPFKEGVEAGHDEEREHGGGNEAPNDDDRERTLYFRPRPAREEERYQSERGAQWRSS